MREKGWKVIMVLNIPPSTHTQVLEHTFIVANCISCSSEFQWVSNIIVEATPASGGAQKDITLPSPSPCSLGPTGTTHSLSQPFRSDHHHLNHPHPLADLPSPIPPQAAHPPTSSHPPPPSAKPPPPATPPPSPSQPPYKSPSPPHQPDTKHNTSQPQPLSSPP